MKPLVSVIIVAYRNLNCLEMCLKSIEPDPKIEVVVVNNSHQNRGFGSGCNLGASIASGEVLVFLNPDSVASAVSIISLAAIVRGDDSIGIVGPALVDPTGKVVLSVSEQPTGGNFWLVYSFLNRWLRKVKWVNVHWYGYQPPPHPREVGVVSGAVMVMRKKIFDKIGGFDEHFFLYWEEVDLAKRCLASGLRVVFWPSIVIRHDGGLSTVQGREKVMGWFRESRYYFMKKYFGWLYAMIVEGWLALSEHWPLTLVMMLYGAWLNPGGMVTAAIVYNEAILELGKVKAGVLGFVAGMLGFLMPQVYVLLILGGWLLFDLIQPLIRYRRWFVIGGLLGGLCLL